MIVLVRKGMVRQMITYRATRTGYQGASRLRDGKSRATHIVDERLKAIAERIDLRGTDVLDIGCNKGYITVQVGMSFTFRFCSVALFARRQVISGVLEAMCLYIQVVDFLC